MHKSCDLTYGLRCGCCPDLLHVGHHGECLLHGVTLRGCRTATWELPASQRQGWL